MPQSSLYQEEHHPSPLQYTWMEFKNNHIAVVGLFCFAFFLIIIIFCPLLAPFDPNMQQIGDLLIPPAWDPNGGISHLFGTDALGRDLLSRIIYGCRMTLALAFYWF